MHKRKYLVILIIIFLTLLEACSKSNSKKSSNSSDDTPTFFIHGYASSDKAEEHMAKAALYKLKSAGLYKEKVEKDGRVTMKAYNTKKSNPIVLVTFEDNRNTNYSKNSYYTYRAIKFAQQKLKFKDMNIVAHSMGNLDVMYMLLKYKDIPKLNKQVSIAGHYNGYLGMGTTERSPIYKNGKPKKMNNEYLQLLKLRKVYPNNVKVLNIFGDIQDGSKSDGRVSVSSAKSLRYLVSPRVKSYQEKEIKGSDAQHSKLHENKEVDNLIIKFLWNKN